MAFGAFGRYVRHSPNPTTVVVQTATAVNIGDPVGIATNGAFTKPSQTTWNTSLAQTQADFAAMFAGTSAQYKEAGKARVYGNGEDNIIRIDPQGEFEATLSTPVSCVNGITLLGPAQGTGNTLRDDALAVVSAASQAIAVAVETTTNKSTVRCRLLSRRFPVDSPI
jgi:hypothetical protein